MNRTLKSSFSYLSALFENSQLSQSPFLSLLKNVQLCNLDASFSSGVSTLLKQLSRLIYSVQTTKRLTILLNICLFILLKCTLNFNRFRLSFFTTIYIFAVSNIFNKNRSSYYLLYGLRNLHIYFWWGLFLLYFSKDWFNSYLWLLTIFRVAFSSTYNNRISKSYSLITKQIPNFKSWKICYASIQI